MRALVAALALLALTVSGAQAQIKIKTPQQIAADIKHAVDPASPASTPSTPGACDITLFTSLNVTNVVTTIKNCIGSVVAGGAAPFVTDITAALKSATDAQDGTAMACLKPALAIATAAQGKAAVPGSPEVPAVMTEDGTTVVTPEKAAVPGTPAVYPGPILIFQKYREFVTAGGPSNCKTAVQSTINGTVASAL